MVRNRAFLVPICSRKAGIFVAELGIVLLVNGEGDDGELHLAEVDDLAPEINEKHGFRQVAKINLSETCSKDPVFDKLITVTAKEPSFG
jgi:hypothetical protein